MSRLNGCHNRRAFAPAMLVQDGWLPTGVVVPGDRQERSRAPRMVSVPFRMAQDCRYVPPASRGPDPGCAGCRWKSAEHAAMGVECPAS